MAEPRQDKRALWYGAIAACVIAAAASAAWYGGQWQSGDALAPQAPTADVTPAESKPAATEKVAAATPEAPAPVPEKAAIAPSLDLVRLEQDGSALVAGRAAPGAEVRIIVDGTQIAVATADAAGNFAAFVRITETGQPLVVWLSTQAGDGAEILSEQQVILAPAVEALASAAPEAAGSVVPSSDASSDVAEAGADAGPMPDVSKTGEPANRALAANETPPAGEVTLGLGGAGGPAATQPATVLLSDDTGVGLMRPPPLAGESEIRIDTIAYGAADLVELRGRSGGSGQIRLSLDGQEVAVTETDSEGGWRADLRSVPAGTYTLRAERLDAGGSVTASASVPFRREAPEQVARAAARNGLAQVVTVQPGYTLWGIARDRYGSGIRYVQVFEANKAQIGDPDLIYPGQVFDLPSEIRND